LGYFIGIPASEEFKTIIKSLAESISAEDRPRTPHITLAHLGKQRPDTEGFQEVATSISPFEISIEGMRIFRNREMSHLVLDIAQGAGELRQLNAALRSVDKVPQRNYTPHMTVISDPSAKGYQEMLRLRDKYNGHQWGRMVVTSFYLFSSTAGVSRAVDQWRLLGELL